MRARSRRRFLAADLSVIALVSALVLVFGLAADSGSETGVETVTVLGAERAIPAGFLGLSLEYPAIEAYAGSDPLALDPVFEQLVRNLTPGQRPVLRIGGDSTDWTWWPTPGLSLPPGVTFALDRHWLEVTSTLARSLEARLILGINLEAGSPAVAAAEARALLAGIPRRALAALEIGNEPELYGTFAWYRTANGKSVPGRPASYDPTAFIRDFSSVAAALPRFDLAGPAISGNAWLADVGRFLAAEPEVRMVTLHRYPLQLCFVGRGSPHYPTIANLLAPAASAGLAAALAPSAAVAHSRGLTVRLDELNTVSCGADRAISHTFAAALWAPDALFSLLKQGIDGVNIHTYPGAGYALFTIAHRAGRWRASVLPEYYGLLLFARATPAGSTLLRTSGSGPVSAWATRGRDGQLMVVLINEDTTAAHPVAVRIPGARSPATLVRLLAPAARASTGVTFGGQSFGTATSSGKLAGAARSSTVGVSGGAYRVTMPAASAALLSVGR